MKLVKTNQQWTQSFSPDGEETTNRLDSVQYNIVDDGNNVIGSATIYPTNANVNIYGLGGFTSIEEGEAKLKALFNIAE